MGTERLNGDLNLRQDDRAKHQGRLSDSNANGLQPDDTLLVVDIQNDFCPGGALSVAEGDAVIPAVNRLIASFPHVILTQDWHPWGHLSFVTSHPGRQPYQTISVAYGEQILWPDHCVQGTGGGAFHKDLLADRAELVLRKGFHKEVDSYSAFFENDQSTPTGLAGYLRDRGLRHLFLAGLATDFCVLFSALDARRLGFEVTVIEDACRGIDLGGSLERAWQQMADAGVQRIRATDLQLDHNDHAEPPSDRPHSADPPPTTWYPQPGK